MKLNDFRRFDPAYTGKGLEHGGKLEAQIWIEFASDCKHLEEVARSILTFSLESREESVTAPVKFAHYLEMLFDVNPEQKQAIKNRVKDELLENERKRKNLAATIALGATGKAVLSLIEKLNELEAEAEGQRKQTRLEQQLQALEIDVEFSEKTVEKFIDQFMIAIFDVPNDATKL